VDLNTLSISVQDINFKSRAKESFQHVMEIDKPYGVLETVLEWCKTNLQEDWRWQLVQVSSDKTPGHYTFYFDSERDYFTFVMKWA